MDRLETILLALEQRLLEPTLRRNRAAASQLLADDFREFGSSGRVFDRDSILDLMGAEDPGSAGQPVASITNFALHSLGAEVALVTYTASAAAHTTLRSSLWVHRDGRWQLVFHQGTAARG